MSVDKVTHRHGAIAEFDHPRAEAAIKHLTHLGENGEVTAEDLERLTELITGRRG